MSAGKRVLKNSLLTNWLTPKDKSKDQKESGPRPSLVCHVDLTESNVAVTPAPVKQKQPITKQPEKQATKMPCYTKIPRSDLGPILSILPLFDFLSVFASEMGMKFDYALVNFKGLLRIFLGVGSMCGLLRVLDGIDPEEPWIGGLDPLLMMQRELEGILHRMEQQELSDVYGNKEWIEILPQTHLQTLHVLLQYILDSESFNQRISQIGESIQAEKSARFQRIGKRKDLEAVLNTLEKERINLVEQISKHQTTRNEVNSSDGSDIEDPCHAFQVSLDKTSKEIESIKASLDELTHDDLVGAENIEKLSHQLRLTSKHFIGVDHTKRIYWFVELSLDKANRTFGILVESGNGEEYIRDYEILEQLLKALDLSDPDERMLHKAINEKLKSLGFSLQPSSKGPLLDEQETCQKALMRFDAFVKGHAKQRKSKFDGYFAEYTSQICELTDLLMDRIKLMFVLVAKEFPVDYDGANSISIDKNIKDVLAYLVPRFNAIWEEIPDIVDVAREWREYRALRTCPDLFQWLFSVYYDIDRWVEKRTKSIEAQNEKEKKKISRSERKKPKPPSPPKPTRKSTRQRKKIKYSDVDSESDDSFVEELMNAAAEEGDFSSKPHLRAGRRSTRNSQRDAIQIESVTDERTRRMLLREMSKNQEVSEDEGDGSDFVETRRILTRKKYKEQEEESDDELALDPMERTSNEEEEKNSSQSDEEDHDNENQEEEHQDKERKSPEIVIEKFHGILKKDLSPERPKRKRMRIEDEEDEESE